MIFIDLNVPVQGLSCLHWMRISNWVRMTRGLLCAMPMPLAADHINALFQLVFSGRRKRKDFNFSGRFVIFICLSEMLTFVTPMDSFFVSIMMIPSMSPTSFVPSSASTAMSTSAVWRINSTFHRKSGDSFQLEIHWSISVRMLIIFYIHVETAALEFDSFFCLVMSRDLDSALTLRERTAVDAWLASNKAFHAMRDHPKHRIRMLGGLWGFRPVLNRSLSRVILDKIHNRALIERYVGRADQSFLADHVWPEARSSLLVHDSFHCVDGFGHRTEPFPTQRSSANKTECFVGCTRPCCGYGKMLFKPCPKQCRPKNHPEWLYCSFLCLVVHFRIKVEELSCDEQRYPSIRQAKDVAFESADAQ